MPDNSYYYSHHNIFIYIQCNMGMSEWVSESIFNELNIARFLSIFALLLIFSLSLSLSLSLALIFYTCKSKKIIIKKRKSLLKIIIIIIIIKANTNHKWITMKEQ